MWKQFVVGLALMACGKADPKPTAPADPKPAPTQSDSVVPGVDLVEVPTKLEDLPEKSWTMVTTKTGIVVEGKAIEPITNGDVDPSSKEGGSLGVKITRLASYMAALAEEDRTRRAQTHTEGSFALVMLADRTTPYGLLLEEMFSVKASFRDFAVVVLAADTKKPTALTLHIPDKAPAVPDAKDSTQPLKMIVSASQTDFIVWSISGREGTLAKPKLSVPLTDPQAPAKVGTALTEIVTRDFSGHVPDDQRSIIFMADKRLPASSFVPMMAAMHGAFPDILLSSGFE